MSGFGQIDSASDRPKWGFMIYQSFNDPIHDKYDMLVNKPFLLESDQWSILTIYAEVH